MPHVHDTLSARKVELVPREPGRISLYVCGPTVYEVAHVGHGRTAVAFDVIARYLRWIGLHVEYVTNVTDVEDKIIARAAYERATEPEVAARYEAAYWEQLDRLAVARPDAVPHATEYISQMLDLVARLVAAGHAYAIEGEGVYFSVESYPGYGELSHRRLDDLREAAGARVEIEDRKRDPIDFALWKSAKPGEPHWDSPWGAGRPGWHIECSAMALELLGEGFDLHGGGDDLVFPHHENERAQAEAAGDQFARYWLHAGMVTVGGEKMAKSLGNFTTLVEAIDTYGARAFRMAVLQVHYRSPTELGGAELAAAGRAVGRLDALVRRARARGLDPTGSLDEAARSSFRTAMDDDFATPAATAVIFDAAGRANRELDRDHLTAARPLLATVVELAGALGLAVDRGGEDDAEVDELVARRDTARHARDFTQADALRDELRARGIALEDTPDGTFWHRR